MLTADLEAQADAEYDEGLDRDDHALEAQSCDHAPREAWPCDDQSVEDQSCDDQSCDGQPRDERSRDDQSGEDQSCDARPRDARPCDDQSGEEQSCDGRPRDVQTGEDQSCDAQSSDDQSPETKPCDVLPGHAPAGASQPSAGESSCGALASCQHSSGLPDAREIHARLKMMRACGNEMHMAYIDTLRIHHDCGMCLELGYSSFHQYCDSELGLPKSTAYEYVRVVRALDGLPQLRRLFGEGELSWAQVRAVSRVASAATEFQWIEMAWSEPVLDLLSEVKEAGRTGRDAPRENRHGLPNLLVDLGLKMTLEEKARVLAAFALVAEALGLSSLDELGADPGDELGAEMGAEIGAEHRAEWLANDGRLPIVQWADAVLAGAIPIRPEGTVGRPGDNGTGDAQREHSALAVDRSARSSRPTRAQTIVYSVCRECQRSTVQTAAGRISVSPERIRELEPFSDRIVIEPDDTQRVEVLPAGEVDDPNSAQLRRQVLHRAGLKCSNPACGRRDELQAHHIVFRAKGGRTALSNEVAVCSTCHALIHSGRLDVSGSHETGLVWTPRLANARVEVRDVEAKRLEARELSAACNSSPAESKHGAQTDGSASVSTGDTAVGSAVESAAGPAVESAAGSAVESAVESGVESGAGSPVDPPVESAAESTVESGAGSKGDPAVESAAESTVESGAGSKGDPSVGSTAEIAAESTGGPVGSCATPADQER